MLFTINQTSTMGHLIAKAAIIKVEMANVQPAHTILSFVSDVAEEMACACKEMGASEERVALILDTTTITFAFRELVSNDHFKEMIKNFNA